MHETPELRTCRMPERALQVRFGSPGTPANVHPGPSKFTMHVARTQFSSSGFPFPRTFGGLSLNKGSDPKTPTEPQMEFQGSPPSPTPFLRGWGPPKVRLGSISFPCPGSTKRPTINHEASNGVPAKRWNLTRGRLARKHFSTGAHPAAETPFYIPAASVSARGDAQCVWSHESSISSSYFPLERRRAISHESGLRKLHALRMCSVQVGLCKWLCASCSVQALCACALRKLLCTSALSKLLCASCSVQALCACALCKLVCASCSAQVALRNCSVQVALRKLLCASDSAQVALRKCCRSCGNVLRILFLYLKVAIFQPELRGCAPRTTFVLKSCAGARSAYYVWT